ncbi:MAG: flagellar biosynthesis regulator FlaF [Pseudomonadota bacterium]
MNASQRAQNAYRHHAQAAKTTRDTEYDAFARVTSSMKIAATKGREGYNELVEALHDNRRLWTILAADVASKANSLPSELRARIFYLSEFTQKHSTLVLRKEASVRPLLEINVAVMRGLRQAQGAARGNEDKGQPSDMAVQNSASVERRAIL